MKFNHASEKLTKKKYVKVTLSDEFIIKKYSRKLISKIDTQQSQIKNLIQNQINKLK
jgi:hypothetical protein